MNAGLLISVSTGSGLQVAGQPAADASKAESHADETSFEQVLTQVGERADGSTEPTEAAAPTTASPDSTSVLSPLHIVLALQASALAVVPAGQGDEQAHGDGQSATAQSDSATVTAAEALVASLQAGQTGSATQAGAEGRLLFGSASMAGGDAVLAGAVQTDLPGGLTPLDQDDATGTNQPEPAGQAGTTVQGDLRQTAAHNPSVPASGSFAEPIHDVPAAGLVATDRVQKGEPAGEQAGQPDTSKPPDANVAAAQAGLGSNVRTAAASASPSDGAGLRSVAAAEAASGQPIQAPSELDANHDAGADLASHSGLQNQAMTEQARQLMASAQADKGKESGKGQKETPSSQPMTGTEWFDVGTGNGVNGRTDGTAKVAAVAPVAAPPAEPAAASPVQALRVDVERPDLGGVQVRVVLADQTVHAQVTTGQVEVRDFLIAKQDQLAVGLKASGLEMGEFQVDVDPQGGGQSGPGWFAGTQGDRADQGHRQSEPQATQPRLAEPRPDQWLSYGDGALGGVVGRRALNVFA